MKAFTLALLVSLAAAAPAATAPPWPGDSLYRLSPALTDQAGTATTLDRYQGGPVVVSMFYGSCPHVCPMLIATIQRLEDALPDAQRKNLRVLMVSIDPDRDTPAKLAEVAQRHHADLSRWTFARTGKHEVRRLAAALDIQYRRLPDGAFNHSTVITLLDGDGRIVKQTRSMLRVDPDFQQALAKATSVRP